MSDQSEAFPSTASDDAVIIQCPACHESVTAPNSMIGQLVECPFCKHQFVISAPPPVNKASGRDSAIVQAELASLEGQLRENMSQITELRGHVSRLNMELHRHQIRMKTLTDRNAELQTGVAAARAELG